MEEREAERAGKMVRYKDDDGYAFALGRAVNHDSGGEGRKGGKGARKIALIYGQVSDEFSLLSCIRPFFLSAWM